MARFKVTDTNANRVSDGAGGTVPLYAATLLPVGGTADQAIRMTGPAGSQVASMQLDQLYDIVGNGSDSARYRVKSFGGAGITVDNVETPFYQSSWMPRAAGSTPAQIIQVAGPAGSQVATEMMFYGAQFDLVAA
jgi:hypothetical protein